jgi:uncharacterized protein (DUF2147 family)
MRAASAGTAVAFALLLAGHPVAAGSVPADMTGTWVNPRGTVSVRTGRCGDRLCGWIVWLSRAAAADARDGGVGNPLGTEVLRDYRSDGDGHWRGIVFVPDMGRSFSSRLELVGPGALKISGCLVAGLICRSQTWRRR